MIQFKQKLAVLIFTYLICGTAFGANPCAIYGNTIGIGGTGHTQNEGIGGTGHQLEDGLGGTGISPNNGVGGTGHTPSGGIGGTGQKLLLQNPLDVNQNIVVIGVVTGFASICVNDIEVEYDDNTAVSINGNKTSTGNLSVGQVVTISAESTGKGWAATKISANDMVSGPITKVTGAGRIEVLGQPVNIPKALQAGAAPHMKLGQHVGVQGLRLPNGDILATKTNISPVGRATISGVIKKDINGVSVGGIRLSNIQPGQAPENQHISVTGRMIGKSLAVDNARPTFDVPANAKQLSIQSVVISSTGNRVLLNDGTSILTNKPNTNYLPGSLVHITATKDERGEWQATNVSNQTTNDLFRRSGKSDRPEDNKKGDKNNSGKNDADNGSEDKDAQEQGHSGSNDNQDNDDSDRSENSGSGNDTNTGSNSSGSNSGSSNSRSSNSSGSSRNDSGHNSKDTSNNDKPGGGDRIRVDKPSGSDKPSGGDRIRVDRPSGSDKPSGGDRIRIDKPSGGDRVRENHSGSGKNRN